MSINQKQVENILIIGDLHLPFEKPGYFEFCKEKYKAFNCNKVVFIGDIIDNHYSSYHEVDTDAYGAKYELEQVIEKVKRWVEEFPIADVCTGNHDQLIARKAQSGGIPEAWIRSYSEVLGAPGWTFATDFIYNDVRYSHGHKSGKARTGHKRDMHSLVTGHYHTDLYVDYNFGINKTTFGMAVGAGADDTTYNTNYAMGGKKSAYGLGVVLDDGRHPIAVPMNLKKYEGYKIPNATQEIKERELPTQSPIEERGRKSRQILDESTGDIYIKQKEVQQLLGVSKGYLSSMLNGRLTNRTGFRYIDEIK